MSAIPRRRSRQLPTSPVQWDARVWAISCARLLPFCRYFPEGWLVGLGVDLLIGGGIGASLRGRQPILHSPGSTVGHGVGLLIGVGNGASSCGRQPLPQSPGAMSISLFFRLAARWTKLRCQAGRVLRPRQPTPRSPGAMGISLFFGLTARWTKQRCRAERVLLPTAPVGPVGHPRGR